MASFHHHPDGLIIIRESQAILYSEAVENFVLDLGRPYTGLLAGFNERYYDPKKTHYLSDGKNQHNQSLTWEVGDTYLGALTDLQAAQASRKTPPEPTFERLRESKLMELKKAAADAYVRGFSSAASGTELWYDSDTETQNVLNRQYLIALNNPAVYSSTSFFAGVPVGVTPVRAKLSRTDSDSTKMIQLITASQMVTLGNDLAKAWANVKATLWGLQTQAHSARNTSDLAAIRWPHGS